MRGVRSVAHQHHRRAAVGAAVRLDPGFTDHAGEANPLCRAAKMRRVRHQRVTAQVLGEQLLAERDAVLLAHVVQPGGLPHGLGRFDNEGRRGLIEPIRMRLKPAPRCFLEREGEGVEQLARSEPDEAALPQIHIRLKGGGVFAAHAAVQAVAGNDQVGGDVRVVRHVAFELQVHAHFNAAGLKNVEQLAPSDAAKAVARRAQAAALEVHLDVVPVVEGVEDLRGRFRVGAPQGRQRLVREHHAPAKGVAGAVALEHRQVVRRVVLLHQQRQVQTGRTGTDARDLHRPDNSQAFINPFDGSVSSSSLRPVSMPATGSFAGSSRPTCTSTLAWSQ